MNNSERLTGRWDATAYFRELTERNKLCLRHNFRVCEVSGLQGFEDALNQAQTASNFICISDASDGMMELYNTPHIRQVKTIFIAMRHEMQSAEWPRRRAECLDIMREIFRQFMSAMNRECNYIDQGSIILDPNVQFSEIDRYFFTGCACAYFQLGITQWADLSYNLDEWIR